MEQTNCTICKSELRLILTPNSVHYGMYRCVLFNHFNGWARNPESARFDSKRIGGRASLHNVAVHHKMTESTAICFFCLRNKEELGDKETLTVDHIRELSTAKDGEDLDQVWNMQILCSACHKLKNWTRLYMNWHLKNKGGVQ